MRVASRHPSSERSPSMVMWPAARLMARWSPDKADCARASHGASTVSTANQPKICRGFMSRDRVALEAELLPAQRAYFLRRAFGPSVSIASQLSGWLRPAREGHGRPTIVHVYRYAVSCLQMNGLEPGVRKRTMRPVSDARGVTDETSLVPRHPPKSDRAPRFCHIARALLPCDRRHAHRPRPNQPDQRRYLGQHGTDPRCGP